MIEKKLLRDQAIQRAIGEINAAIATIYTSDNVGSLYEDLSEIIDRLKDVGS